MTDCSRVCVGSCSGSGMSLISINATHADNPSDLLGCSHVGLGDSFHSSSILFSSSINHLFGTGPGERSSRTLGRLIFCKSQPVFRLWLGAQMGMVFWRLQLIPASQHQQLFFVFFFLFTRSQTRVYRMGGKKSRMAEVWPSGAGSCFKQRFQISFSYCDHLRLVCARKLELKLSAVSFFLN